jgi:hypothetical protein
MIFIHLSKFWPITKAVPHDLIHLPKFWYDFLELEVFLFYCWSDYILEVDFFSKKMKIILGPTMSCIQWVTRSIYKYLTCFKPKYLPTDPASIYFCKICTKSYISVICFKNIFLQFDHGIWRCQRVKPDTVPVDGCWPCWPWRVCAAWSGPPHPPLGFCPPPSTCSPPPPTLPPPPPRRRWRRR